MTKESAIGNDVFHLLNIVQPLDALFRDKVSDDDALLVEYFNRDITLASKSRGMLNHI